MSKKVKKHWKKHKRRAITWAQIISILGIISGFVMFYLQIQENKLAIEHNNQTIQYQGQWIGRDLSNHTVMDTTLQKQVNSISNKVDKVSDKVENLIN